MARATKKTRETVKQLALDFEKGANDVQKNYDTAWGKKLYGWEKRCLHLLQENARLRGELQKYEHLAAAN